MTNHAAALYLTGDPESDDLLSRDANALLLGMILDQQVAMEKAFSGPWVIAQRMDGKLDVDGIAAMDVEDFTAVCSQRPAIHRFPGAMGRRVHQVCRVLAERYDADAGNIWADVSDGAELKRRLTALPGLGEQKASIFVALLGKQYGVTPAGWQQAAGGYGESGVFRSVADITDEVSLQKVRETKKAEKAKAKARDAA